MTPRGTDWSLALLVGLGFTTGLLTLFAGTPGWAWIFAAHAIGGAALALVLVWKLRRIAGRIAAPARWDRATVFGLLALGLVAVTLGSGWLWASGITGYLAGYNLIAWHFALGFVLGAIVLWHAAKRARRPRARDLAGRRQFLATAGVAAGAVAAWQVQGPLARALGWRGARRRYTGSYERGSFAGNGGFPATSWVADAPRELDRAEHRLAVTGKVARTLDLGVSDCERGDELVATLDCTGGFHTTQRWRGVRLGRLLDRAGPADDAGHVRIVSHTGYRWSFPLAEARELLLATHIGDEPLDHGHGAPLRLVAPGHRGFEWVKWVTRVELHEHADLAAPATTLLSWAGARGRGAA